MDHDAIVVGAGIVGLAIARALAQSGRRVVVLEAERAIGQHASSRNSEVVHAGIYHPPGSLKATLCRRGRAQLLAYCADRGIATRTTGKLIVAGTEDERATLAALHANAAACGVALQWCDRADVARREPAIHCVEALLAPTTAIVDSHALLRALLADVREAGGELVLGCRFERATPTGGGLRVWAGDADVTTRQLFVAAGALAPRVAATIDGFAAAAIPTVYLAKGHYFGVRGGPRLRHLVYPVPRDGGLGIHVTLDLAGNLRLGPDVEWVESIDYDVDPARAAGFLAAASRYLPELRAEQLHPAYAGIRAKIVGPGQPAADFVICTPAQHGVAGTVALFGIESPGLTAALALAAAAAAAAD